MESIFDKSGELTPKKIMVEMLRTALKMLIKAYDEKNGKDAFFNLTNNSGFVFLTNIIPDDFDPSFFELLYDFKEKITPHTIELEMVLL